NAGESFQVFLETPQGWQKNGDNVTLRTDGMTDVPTTTITFKTAGGNSKVSPGDYNMPVTLSFNTW
ncbi:hypothetical protein ACWA3Y_24560, partial [Escherichia coli]